MLEIDTTKVVKAFRSLEKGTNSHYFGCFSAVFMRNIKIISQYKLSILIGLLSTLVAFSLYFFLSLLVPNQQINFYGISVSSAEFIVIGMLTVDLTTRAIMNSLNSFVSEMRQGTFVPVVVQPFGLKNYIIAEIFFENVYSFLLSFFYYTPIFLFFPIFRDCHINFLSFVTLLIILLAIFTFFLTLSLVVSTLSLLLKRSRELSLILVAILQLLSGALFPLSVFPPWLRLIAIFSPYTLAIDALRLCVLGHATVINVLIAKSIVSMLITSIVLYFIFVLNFKIVIKKLKNSGEIQNY